MPTPTRSVSAAPKVPATPAAKASAKTAPAKIPTKAPVPAPAVAPAPVSAPVTASTAVSPSQPLVTVAQIQAAAAVVSTRHNGKQRIAHIAGRSAATLEELKSVVRGLAKAGRLDDEALAMLAEGDADDARALLQSTTGASSDAVRGALTESILADFTRSIEVGEEGSEHAGMVREVYHSAWWMPKEGAVSAEALDAAENAADEVPGENAEQNDRHDADANETGEHSEQE